jgi:hypothetical protein
MRQSERQQRLAEAVRLSGRIRESPEVRLANVKALSSTLLQIVHTDLGEEAARGDGGEVSLGKPQLLIIIFKPFFLFRVYFPSLTTFSCVH